jgi:hypothetical protein
MSHITRSTINTSTNAPNQHTQHIFPYWEQYDIALRGVTAPAQNAHALVFLLQFNTQTQPRTHMFCMSQFNSINTHSTVLRQIALLFTFNS